MLYTEVKLAYYAVVVVVAFPSIRRLRRSRNDLFLERRFWCCCISQVAEMRSRFGSFRTPVSIVLPRERRLRSQRG